MQLNQFNGGLNTRLAPHLINANEAVVYKNIDNSSISLRPIKSTTDEETLISKYFINFKDTWVSSSTYKTYKEFKEKLYYSDGVGKPQKSSDGVSWNNLGIDKPTVKATATLLEVSINLTSTTGGDLLEEPYSYKFGNVVDGILNIVHTGTGTILAGNNAISISNIVNIDVPISVYREYLGTYRLVGTTSTTLLDSTLDISANAELVDEVDAKYLSGTYQYCYTFYNDTDGTESQPSEYSNNRVIENGSITVSGQGSSDPQVDIVRIYRLGGNLTSMTLVTEVPNPGQVTFSYTDKAPDLEVDGHILDSFNNAPSPTGLKHLTEHNAMFFGCIEDKLYYSDIAYVNYWSDFNFIDFDDVITGLGATANGLLVFTKYKTYIVTGTSPLTLSKYLISSNQGCLEHRSISFAKNTLLWASTDGICASNGGNVIVFSRDKLGKISLTDIRDSIVYDDVYYLGYGDKLLALDTRFGNILREVSQEVHSLSIYNDVLYYTLEGKLYSLFTNVEYLSMEYKSPKLSEGQLSNLKNYKTVYTRCLGELEIKIYIDDEVVITKAINSKTTEILIPQQKRQGYYIQFEVTGTGELLELQYIVEGRQNGR